MRNERLFSHWQRITSLMVLVVASACTQPSQARQSKGDAAEAVWRAPFDRYYGVYLQGRKVGWMRTELARGQGAEAHTMLMRTSLTAKMVGMGDVASMTLREERVYGGVQKRLQRILFKQTSPTGSVEVRGAHVAKSDVDAMELTISAGGQSKVQRVSVTETLDDALIASRIAAEAKFSKSRVAVSPVHASHFDASMQQMVQTTYTLKQITERMLGGVATPTVEVVAHYPALQITESMVLDRQGQILETHLGGFFEARLETEEEAKRLSYQHDLLLNAVVKTPKPIVQPTQLATLQIGFDGFDDILPPVSLRQHLILKTQNAEQHTSIVLQLQRDPTPPIVRLAGYESSLTQDPTLKEELVATPFIQSDAAEIRATAKRVIGNASDVYTASTRLTHYVFLHVKDAYIPAYSNALEALHTKRGDCTEHSVLFVALARSLGIPARVAVGIAYWPPGDGFGWHAWAEVYIGGAWYSVDPTWDQPIADATHIKLAGGGPMEQARIVMLLGRLRVTSVVPTPPPGP